MAVGTIGDAHKYMRDLREIKTQRTKIEAAKTQAMSGVKYAKGRDLGGQVVLVNSIQREMKLCEGFINQNKTYVTNRLSGEEQAIRQIQNEAIRFKESLVSFCDGNTAKDSASFLVEFKQHLQTIEHAGNTKVGDSYIFGGTKTNVPPFDVSKIADGLDPNSGATLDYYNGNDIPVLTAIDTDDNLECDLMGQHPAFEKLIRALKIASDPSIQSGDARVTKAQDLVDEAITEFCGLVAKVGAKEVTLETLIEAQEDKSLYLSEAYNKIVEVIPEEAATIFMNEHAILEARFAMMSRLSKMSLSEYM
jgi:flagellar hook-associated protein 3 FlgL